MTAALTLDAQLQGYLDHLTIERGVAANTLSSYRRDLRRYFEHLTTRGVDDLANVAEDDVSEFLVALRRGDPDAGISPLSAVSAARWCSSVPHTPTAATTAANSMDDVIAVPTPGIVASEPVTRRSDESCRA